MTPCSCRITALSTSRSPTSPRIVVQCPLGLWLYRSHPSRTTTMRLFSRLAECLVWIAMFGTRASEGMKMRSALLKVPGPCSAFLSACSGLRAPAYSRQLRLMMPTTRPFALPPIMANDFANSKALCFSSSAAEGALPSAPNSESPTSRRILLSARSLNASPSASRRSTATTSPSNARLSAKRPEISISSSSPQTTLACMHVFMCMRMTPCTMERSLMRCSISLAFK
mmetsp:Transcript_20648/g.39184  ORF Transcript_20648/g.39184 Transcript_20648/m.39184 type:complete len:227 (+) Transcript_20648:1542-2222(+)